MGLWQMEKGAWRWLPNPWSVWQGDQWCDILRGLSHVWTYWNSGISHHLLKFFPVSNTIAFMLGWSKSSFRVFHGILQKNPNFLSYLINHLFLLGLSILNLGSQLSCIGDNLSFLLPSVHSLSHVWLFATPWTVAYQASLSITNSQSSPKLMSIDVVMPSNHLVLCRPLLLLPSIFPSIRVFSNESALHIRWPKYWSSSFNISPSNDYSGLISFRMNRLNLLALQGTLKSLL